MSEYIKREPLLEQMLERKRPLDGEDNSKARWRYIQWLTDYNSIMDAPAEDVTRVIRCKDCMWWSKLPPDKQFIEGRIYGTCYKWSAMARNDIGTQSHYYCVYGKRKDDE